MSDMSDADLRESVAALQDALVATQAMTLATRQIVWQIAIDLAKMQPNPEQYVRDLFERTYGNLERESEITDRANGLVPRLAREEIETLFCEFLARLHQAR